MNDRIPDIRKMIPFPDIPNELHTEMDRIKGDALKGAFRKGVIACRELGLKAVNPYKKIYRGNGRGTFSFAFKNAWDRGYEAYRKHFNKLKQNL